jgi:hypothetical protein
MNTIQEDKLSMYYVVRQVCDTHQSVWVENAVFAATHELWAVKIPMIEANRDAQTLATTGITTDKTAKRAVMTEKALFIANRLQSYATVVNNPALLESVKYSASDLKKARDTEVVGICNTICTKADDNAEALVPYGVTEELISELQEVIAVYSATQANPKAAISQTKTATENLARLFKEADILLTKRMDLDIELFKTSNPDFYSQYKTARIITETGNRVSSVLGSVTNAGSGDPVPGVTFTFVTETAGMLKAAGAATAKPMVKKSSDKGKFRATMPENTYRVTVEKIGFRKQEVVINVANGETTKLNIELEMN